MPARPFYRAFFQDNSQVESLSKRLDAAEKQIIEYLQLIASLSAELKRYQDIICRGCKESVIRATLSAGSAPDLTQSTHAVSASTDSSDSRQLSALSSLGMGVHDQLSEFGRQSSINLLVAHSGKTESHNLADTSSDNLRTHDDLPTTRPTVPPHFIDMSETAFPYISERSTAPASMIQSKYEPSCWSVEYNPETQATQSLRLTLANTFTLTDKVYCAKFSRDGKYLAVGLPNGVTHIHDMLTGSKSVLVKSSRSVFYNQAPVKLPSIWALRFSLDNKYIVTASEFGEIDMWEIGRRRVCASFKHKAHVRAIDLSPNGHLLVSASYDKSVCIWNIRDGSRRNQWYGSRCFSSVSYHPDGRHIAAGDEGAVLWVWDTRTGQLFAKCKINGNTAFNSVYLRAIFTPDGKRLATGRRGRLQCWDFGLLKDTYSRSLGVADISSQLDPNFEFDGNKVSLFFLLPSSDINVALFLEKGYITAISFSSDNRWVVLSSKSKHDNVWILDARTGQRVCTLKGHEKDVWVVDFSPTGHYIVSGCGKGLVRLWRYELLE